MANNHQDFSLDFAGTPFPMSRDGWGGQLGGLYEAEYNGLRSTQETVKEIAEHIADLFKTVMEGGSYTDPNGKVWTWTGGRDLAGASPDPLKPLFQYDPSSISAVLTVSDLKPEELAFSSDGAPGSNGTLLELLQLKSVAVEV